MWKVTYQQSLPMLKKYRENSLRVDSEEMRRIRRAARDNQIYVSMGFSELDHATLYLAQVLISPDGSILNHRRKIKPTHVEKLVYGDGAGDTVSTTKRITRTKTLTRRRSSCPSPRPSSAASASSTAGRT